MDAGASASARPAGLPVHNARPVGFLLIVGKLAGKRLASIAFGVLMIAWRLLCGIPELRSWMLARATDLEHTLEAMWAGLDGDGRMLVYIFALWLMGAIVIMVGGRR